MSRRAVTPVVIDDDDVEWQPCHCGRGSGLEQPGECAGDSHDGGWRWGAPLGRVAWSRLDPRTGSGTLLNNRLRAAPTLVRRMPCPLVSRLIRHAQAIVAHAIETQLTNF